VSATAALSVPNARAKKRVVPWYLPRDIRYRRRLRFTREGKLFVFVTLGLGFAAVNTGTNLMYLVFGFMLSLIVLSGVLSEHVLRALTVERRLPQRAVAGEPALVELVVKNGKQRLVSYSVEIEDQAEGDDNLRRCYFLKIPPRGEQAASYRRVPLRRGVLRFSGFSIATRFPFALFEKSRDVELASELLVYPRPLPAQLPDALFKEQGERSASARGRGTETRELREYRQDDEVRMIHWRRSAALGKPVVRFASVWTTGARPRTRTPGSRGSRTPSHVRRTSRSAHSRAVCRSKSARAERARRSPSARMISISR
jgi:uncharacterized protein (DUF58 family)